MYRSFLSLSSLIAAIVLLVSAPGTVRAQMQDDTLASPFSVGVYTGVGVVQGVYPSLSIMQDAMCPLFTGSTKPSFTAGISADWIIDNDDDPFISLLTRVGYTHTAADFIVTSGNQPSRVVRQGQEEIVQASTDYHATTSFSLITADIASNLMPFPRLRLGFVAGFSLGFPIATSYSNTVSITDPSDAAFIRDPNTPYEYSDDSRTLYIARDAEVPDVPSVVVSMLTGVQYPFSFHRIEVIPSMLYRYPLGNTSETEHWLFSRFQACVDVRLRL